MKNAKEEKEEKDLGLYGFLIFGGIAAFLIYNNLFAKKSISFFGQYNNFDTNWLNNDIRPKYKEYTYAFNKVDYYQHPQAITTKVLANNIKENSNLLNTIMTRGIYGFLD